MEDNKGSTKNLTTIFEKLSNYKIVITTITIVIGFVYLQGLFSNYTSKFSFLDLFIGASDIPASIDTYITSGFIFISSLVIQITISYIIIHIIAIIKAAFKQNSQFKEDKIHKKYFSTLIKLGISFNFILPVLCAVLFYLLYERIHIFTIFWLWFFNIIFMTVLIFSFSILHRYKEHFKESKQEAIYMVSKLLLILSVSLSSLFIIYYSGHISQDIKLEKILKGNSGFNFVRIYFTDSSGMAAKGYYKLYLTKDYFVGYDDVEKKTLLLPMQTIKKIENWNAVDPTKMVEKYVPGHTDTQRNQLGFLSPEKAIINVIENFYKYRTGNLYGQKTGEINAEKVIKLLTTRYYKNNFNLLNPDILEQRWFLSKEYNGKDLKDFCGFEISVPEKGIEKHYYVYVLEAWKDFSEYLKYTLVTVNDHWYIDDIDKKCIPFEFDMK